jgi:oligopeptide transport system substrate-binding protein
MRATALLMTAALLLAGCHGGGNQGTIAVSLIGDRLDDTVTIGTSSEGLVRLDREGQVIPGAAARWAILDDGLDYIFRIDDGAGLSAQTVARRLRDALRRHRRNPDFAALGPVESIEAVTGTVVEMRLAVPQPDLLPLLARPELAVGAPTDFRPGKLGRMQIAIEPRPGDDAPSPLLLRVEHVGRAVVRFQNGDAELVTGGTFADLPVAHAAQPARKSLRFDPATGLFGFAILNAGLPATVRTALSLAIDRDRIVTAIGVPNHAKATTIAGSTLEPPLTERRGAALALLKGETAHIRVAMPRGPGAHLLFALAARDWAEVGISAEMVGPEARSPDLALIDRVAPPGTLAVLACALSAGCDPADRMALINPPFIPIAAPVRWSLVAPSLDLFTENSLAAHPLDQLRSGSHKD